MTDAKEFLRTAVASMFGVALGLVMIFFMFMVIVGLLYFKESREFRGPELERKSILEVDLDSEIVERVDKYPLGLYEGIPLLNKFQKIGLYSLQQTIEKASTDKNVEILYLKLGQLDGGWASISSIYESLAKFKRAGKTIISYSEAYSEKSYYLASLSNKVYLYPAGQFEFNGLSMVQTFLKGLFAKLKVRPHIFRVGKFKSAVEPFFLDKMSKESAEQSQSMLTDIWQNLIDKIQKNRHIPAKTLQEWSLKGTIQNANDALKAKLVDGLSTEDEVVEFMKARVRSKGKVHKDAKGKDKDKDKAKIADKGAEKDKAGDKDKDKEKLKVAAKENAGKKNGKSKKRKEELKDEDEMVVPWTSYEKLVDKADNKRRSTYDSQIALVYLTGEIVDGKGQEGKAGSVPYVDLLRDLAEDDSIKAVVMRISSPGGSALASDVLWNEIGRLKRLKPVVASLGDVAASGAYYIASNCDWINARPNAITGSIGVFGIYMNLQEFFHNYLGVTFDGVVTGPLADMGQSHRPLSKSEENIIQGEVNLTYNRFLDRVAHGRKFPEVSQVASIAEGRVWSGKRAKDLGLIDDWGGISEALEKASILAKLNRKYYVETYPKRRNAILDILNSFQDSQVVVSLFPFLKAQGRESKGPFGEWERLLKSFGLDSLLSAGGHKLMRGNVMMMMPLELTID